MGSKECVLQLQEIMSMEPDLISINLVSDHMEQLEIVAKEVIPKLQ